MLVPLRDATHSLKIGGDTVYLFAFPPEALTGIILGAHVTVTFEASVRNLLNDRPELRHVHLSRALLDFDTRSVKLQWPAAITE